MQTDKNRHNFGEDKNRKEPCDTQRRYGNKNGVDQCANHFASQHVFFGQFICKIIKVLTQDAALFADADQINRELAKQILELTQTGCQKLSVRKVMDY